MIEIQAFKVECNNCGRTGNLSLYNGEIISDGDVVIVADEHTLGIVYCKGCNSKIENDN